MAIVQNPITGRTKKAFGTAVFSKQFGKNTMRTKPIEVKNPRTIGQVTQRSKFSTTVAFVRQVLPLINEVYAGRLTKMSPFNKVTSLIVKNAFVGEPPVLDQTLVKLADIEGSSVLNVVNTGLPDQVMKVNWDPNTTIVEELNSKLSFVLVNCVTNEVMTFRDVELRSVGVAEFTAPASWADCDSALHVVTKDYSNLNKPKMVVKFAPGNELSGHVK